MMKKVLASVVLLIVMMSVSGCEEKKYYEWEIVSVYKSDLIGSDMITVFKYPETGRIVSRQGVYGEPGDTIWIDGLFEYFYADNPQQGDG